MKLCDIGIHKWIYQQPSVYPKQYRTCSLCNKTQVKDTRNDLIERLPIWWTVEEK